MGHGCAEGFGQHFVLPCALLFRKKYAVSPIK
jgi:hypothetical protein